MAPSTALEPPSGSPPDDTEAPVAASRPLLRGWLHLAAFCAVVVAGPVLVARAPTAGSAALLSIYVLSLAVLFGTSAAFHRVRWQPAARRRMRRADHAAIFIGIAGSYTAVAGLVMTGWPRVIVLCLVWGGAAGGITLRQVWLDAPKWAVALPYVVVGWCAVAVAPELLHGLGGIGFGLLMAGGACYTVGALVYALRRPNPFPSVFGYHEIFHTLTIVAATLHFIAIAAYALPRARA